MRAVPERYPPRPRLWLPPTTLKVATLNDTVAGLAGRGVGGWPGVPMGPIEAPAVAGARLTTAIRAGTAARAANFFTRCPVCSGTGRHRPNTDDTTLRNPGSGPPRGEREGCHTGRSRSG